VPCPLAGLCNLWARLSLPWSHFKFVGVEDGHYGRLAYFFSFSKLINWLIVYRVIDDISQYVAIENLLTMLGYAIITLTACMRVSVYI